MNSTSVSKRRSSRESGAAAEKTPEGTTDKALLCVLGAASAVRIVYFWDYLHSAYNGLLVADQRFYWNWGVRISLGEWLGNSIFPQGPLYAYLLGAFFTVFGRSQTLVLFVQLLAGIMTCLLIYDCALRLFDRRTAVVAGLTASVFGPFVFYECMVMKTFLSPLFTTLTLWAALRYREDRLLRWLLLAGVLRNALRLAIAGHDPVCPAARLLAAVGFAPLPRVDRHSALQLWPFPGGNAADMDHVHR